LLCDRHLESDGLLYFYQRDPKEKADSLFAWQDSYIYAKTKLLGD